MLPQMMPLPWLMVFFLIFFSFYSVMAFFSLSFFSKTFSLKVLNFSLLFLFW